MRILNSLYVQGYGAKLSLQKGSLLVTRRDATRVRVPIESLDGVVLLGSALVTTDAIGACVDRGIRISSLRRGGQVRFIVGGPTHGNLHLRLAQLEAARDPVATAALARWFVAGKLQNYRRLLQRWRSDVDEPALDAARRAGSDRGTPAGSCRHGRWGPDPWDRGGWHTPLLQSLTARLGQEGVGLVSDLEPAAHLGTP
jgi:CRISPR/Cas system-associated endonuclease Cas1